MVRFYSRIRKKLLSDGRIGKYLKYAVGEILLVMIGILLALQVNNWNEERKANEIQEKYLSALKIEFENNLKEVNRVLSLCDTVYDAGKSLLNKTTETGQKLDVEDLYLKSMKAFRFPPKFTQSPGILNDLVNSGYLSKIKNPDLRSKLQLWFVMIEQIGDEEEEFWLHREKIIDLMQREMSFRRLLIALDEDMLGEIKPKESEIDNESFYYKDHFDNLLLFYTILVKSLEVDYYPGLKANIESILNEIDKSLSEI